MDRPIIADGRQALAVWAERYAVHDVAVACQWLADRLATGDIPEADRLIIAAGCQEQAIRAERHTVHVIDVASQRLPDRLAGGDVPEAKRAGRSVDRWQRPRGGPSCRSCRMPDAGRLD